MKGGDQVGSVPAPELQLRNAGGDEPADADRPFPFEKPADQAVLSRLALVARLDPAISARHRDGDPITPRRQPAQYPAMGKVGVSGIKDVLGHLRQRRMDPVLDHHGHRVQDRTKPPDRACPVPWPAKQRSAHPPRTPDGSGQTSAELPPDGLAWRRTGLSPQSASHGRGTRLPHRRLPPPTVAPSDADTDPSDSATRPRHGKSPAERHQWSPPAAVFGPLTTLPLQSTSTAGPGS